MFFRVLALLAGVAALARPAAAQHQGFELVDRIVAVVGNVPIPLSRLEEELNLFESSDNELPSDPAELRALRVQLVERMIHEELLVQAALRDTTIVVSREELQEAVDQALRDVRSQFTNPSEFEEELRVAGFGTEAEYRAWFGERQRRDILRSRFLTAVRDRGELVVLPPSEEELREYFEFVGGQFGRRPATVDFRQVVIRPEADSSAVETARQLADSVRQLLEDGEDFGRLARGFSDDPGTRENGGELGYFRRGVMHRDFEAVAFRLRPGQIAPPVRTPFGFHIIEVQRIETAEVQARHILIAPEITEADVVRAETLADSLVVLLRNGAPADSIARAHHDETEQSIVERAPVGDLPPAYGNLMAFAIPGQALGPVRLEIGENRAKFAIIVFGRLRPEGDVTFEDVRDQLEPRLAEENAIGRLVQRLRRSAYIDIRLEP
ncbi:MAG: peptidylprolyl isomerase [Gemmatimonadales bacterium]